MHPNFIQYAEFFVKSLCLLKKNPEFGMISLVWPDSSSHCLTTENFKSFQFVGFDGRQPAFNLPH